MNQRLWNSSLNIVFSVLLLILAAILASSAVKAARATDAASPGQIRCAELPVRDSVELDAFYLKEI